MKTLAEYLNPRCTLQNLDRFLVRTAVLRALRDTLYLFSGTLLDIGCGHMPYKSLVLSRPSRVQKYVGLDLEGSSYWKPDLKWNGSTMPLEDNSVDCAMAIEVFEHCPEPEMVMRETFRVLKSGGLFFFTVPFLWPLHDVPHDQYRYTPFALTRHLSNVGFENIQIKALGGWDASLAQIIGLWARRRPLSKRKRSIIARLALPIVRFLANRDIKPSEFNESCMITGLSGTAVKGIT